MSIEKVAGVIRSAESLMITSHVDLDGDAVGSELGLGLVLEKMGKNLAVVNQDPLPPCYRFLPGKHLLRNLGEGPDCFDAALVLDCTSLERTGSVGEFISSQKIPVANIDHHGSNVCFGAINCVRPDACAAAILVLEIISKLGQSVSPDVATCLYAAVLAETGSFRLSNTSAEALEVSARLAGEGADPFAVAAQVYGKRSPATLRLIGEALRSLEVLFDGRMSIITLDRAQLNAAGAVGGDELEGVVNFAMTVEGIRVGVFLRELPGGIVKMSLRSNGTVDVDVIARKFGGGGHSNAAGAKVPGTLEGVRGAVIERIAEALAGG
ncbi:MAG: bifunctional oligoribonuclease/PAP phosphatase NrnA [Candidatus Eisenbacteria bacterium]